MSGSAYIFHRIGNAWSEVDKLTASNAGAMDEFGYSVSISGDYAVIGAYKNEVNGIGTGSAYVFKRTGNNWVEQVLEPLLRHKNIRTLDYQRHTLQLLAGIVMESVRRELAARDFLMRQFGTDPKVDILQTLKEAVSNLPRRKRCQPGSGCCTCGRRCGFHCFRGG